MRLVIARSSADAQSNKSNHARLSRCFWVNLFKMSSDLEDAKQRLVEKLGSNYNLYIRLLGRWFRGFISKEEFDRSAKLLVQQNFVPEHNQFWLALFHHCAKEADVHLQGNRLSHDMMNFGDANKHGEVPIVRCLPNKLMTHVKIFVIVWEMGLDSINDQVSIYVKLALQQFLKNIITELICSKTAYRIRENRFRYAVGVRPINPYLINSLNIYNSNLDYDPYQIEYNKMSRSLVDTYVYDDTLFPWRLYESQAVYQFACSTSKRKDKRRKFSEISLEDGQGTSTVGSRLSLYHLLTTLLYNKAIIPSHRLQSLVLERIFTKY